ncbi:hypothetical protein Z043_115914, partial [Scleropages formosus]
SATAKLGPGDIGPHKETEINPAPRCKKNSADIWSEERLAEDEQSDGIADPIADPRQQPEYEIVLKQSVGTEDLFLGMSRKDPSSMCCESMLVRIKLPGTNVSEVDLDVKEQFLELRTPKFKLGLHLPHPVRAHKGKAQFIAEREVLEVSLPMNRLLDDLNLA